MNATCWHADTDMPSLPFLTEKEKVALDAAGLLTVRLLISRLPKRYEDRRRFDAFPAQVTGKSVCLRGRIVDCKTKGFGSKGFFEAIVQDGGSSVFQSNVMTCRWFNMPFMSRMLASGQDVILYGRPKEQQSRLIIDHPEIEVINSHGDEVIHLERIVPVYKNVSGIKQRRLREIQYWALEGIISDEETVDLLPDGSLRADSWRVIHFPDSLEAAAAARRRFALEEFFLLQLGVLRKRALAAQTDGYDQGRKTALLTQFYRNLPFDLTGAQKRTVKEIAADMRSARPMSRLLQGDVGSGKTFVALCTILLAVDSGGQAALMAPTQILAEQHFLTFQKWLTPLGLRVSLITGSREDSSFLEMEGDAQIIIGTHALLYNRVAFDKLTLAIIDEQHKFGVLQRDRLVQQGEKVPDLLVMTATPIPRTLTLTLYGDLDVSVLDERPANRGKVITGVRISPKVTDVSKFLKSHLENNRQIYLVYPLVDESDSVKAGSAIREWEKWVKRLKNFEVGLLHGKLSGQEKEDVMERFRANEVNVLVSTTVIEVGVDVPNANVMVIYDSDRFGLAQLHQLRGRIGRGEHTSYCVLVTNGKNPEAVEKLEILASTDDGFQIAEEDLRLRGPGEVLGTQQSGLADLHFADFLADTDLIREARRLAEIALAAEH